MNEQELMKQIDEHTKNLEIPDSISPDNMKKMLDEQVGKEGTIESTLICKRAWIYSGPFFYIRIRKMVS